VFREVKDSLWSADHIARHGVTLDEVLQDQDEAFIVTARDMTPSEKKTFQRKAR